MAGPNPISVTRSILRARRLTAPRPRGSKGFDHGAFNPILAAAAAGSVEALMSETDTLGSYMAALAAVDPDGLTADGALAYWINLYNAGALDLARRSLADGHSSVLKIGGGFSTPVVTVGREALSLEGIEHGKIRRFRDPRIHAALVCGSVSCPTLAPMAFEGDLLDSQLEAQMRYFLSAGAAVADRTRNVAYLSRVFLWFGADFVRPSRMPTLLPSKKRRIASAVSKWLAEGDAAWLRADHPKIRFQKYDWALGCAVRPQS